MALNSQYSTTQRNASLTALLALMAAGKLRLYGPAQPADADTAIGAQVKLVEWGLGTPAGGVANGVLTLTPPAAVAALATGVATWFDVVENDGATILFEGSAGRRDYAADGVTPAAGTRYNLELNSAVIQQGADVAVTAFTLTTLAAGT